MEMRLVGIVMMKEWRDIRRARWFASMAMIFTGVTLALSYFGLAGLGTFGVTGFGRTAASLLNLVLLIVPLMGLLMGALSLAAEREHGTLVLLLAQPVTATEVFVGKFLGLALALALALLIGFGLSGLVVLRYHGWAQLDGYAALAGLTVVLGVAHIAIGLSLSAAARRVAPVLGAALLLWLVIIFISDLGLMGTAMVLKLTPAHLLWLSLANPLQVFKVAAIQAIQGNLELLGAGGVYAASVCGPWLMPLLIGLLGAWTMGPLLLAWALFHRRGAV
jgi:Cu-processing system permease protein